MEQTQNWLDELTEMANRIQASMKKGKETKVYRASDRWIPDKRGDKVVEYDTFAMNEKLAAEWLISVEAFFLKIFGCENPTYARFKMYCDGVQKNGHWYVFENCLPIFKSGKRQVEGKYLFDIRNLANAAVFRDELEQAEYLLAEDYLLPAAVIAGTVLETTLRTLCEQTPSITLPEKPTGSDMNNKLKKPGGVIDEPQRSQNDAWIKIRNLAAHGKPEFESITSSDIKRMIDGIRDFVAKHMN